MSLAGRFEARGAIGIIWIDNPPVNAISVDVRRIIVDGVQKLNADPGLSAAVLACDGRTFMAGADITEFGRPPLVPSLREAVESLESSSKVIVAAIHGTAYGGGLEVALACHYRLAVESAQVGLPEVKLGLLPGAGGTQRLPRLIGVEPARRLISSGDPWSAPMAAQAGVIDRIVELDPVAGAVAYAEELVAQGAALRRVRDLVIDPDTLPSDYFAEARKRLSKERRNVFAPQRIVDALEAAATLPFEQGLIIERELFLACMAHSQSKALQHVFFAERKASNISNLAKSTPKRPIKKVAVVGAGAMGAGITMNFLSAGMPVMLLEATPEALARGVTTIRANYEATAAKGRLTMAQVEERLSLVKPTLAYEDLSEADLIIEAVFETMSIKREVFSRLARFAKCGAILASNTSYLSIDHIAQVTDRPGDVLGMHFFSPANVMRLLEIVRGEQTEHEVLATIVDLARRINKVGVVCRNRDGFIGNRMLSAYAHQAMLMGLQGAEPAQVDAALRNFGFPMGAYQISDLAGLDISYKSRKDRDPSSYDTRVTHTADRLVEMGRLGQKSRAGYYDYDPGDRNPKPSTLVKELMAESGRIFGIEPRSFTDEDIVERCMFSLVNMGCEVLREGVATRAGDIDIVWINGYGFPAYRGGPMYWAENEIGLPRVLSKLNAMSAEQGGEWLKVSPLLERLVSQGNGFSSS